MLRSDRLWLNQVPQNFNKWKKKEQPKSIVIVRGIIEKSWKLIFFAVHTIILQTNHEVFENEYQVSFVCLSLAILKRRVE